MTRIALPRGIWADPLLNFLLRGSVVAMFTRLAGLALSYLASIILSHSLGASGYGAYSIALAWALLLVLPSRAGLDTAALKFTAIYLNRSMHGLLRGFLRFAGAAILALSAITGVAIFCWFKSGASATTSDLAAATALIIFPLAALGLVTSALRAARRIFASQFYEQILRPGLFILALLVGIAMHTRVTAASALMPTAGSASIALIFGMIHVWRALPRSVGSIDYSPWREWISLSLPLFLGAIIQEALNQTDIVFLGLLADAKSAGLFAAAWRLASIVSLAVAALTSISGPLIAGLHEERNWPQLAKLAGAAGKFGFLGALFISIPLALGGRQLLLIFGPEFPAAYPALLLLLAGGLANAFTGSVAYLMTMTGRHAHATVIFAGALALSVVLNLLLIPRFGAVGAAIASSSATAAWNIAMLIYVRRAIGIDASAVALPIRRRNGDDAADAHA